jgi:hypothetical protein
MLRSTKIAKSSFTIQATFDADEVAFDLSVAVDAAIIELTDRVVGTMASGCSIRPVDVFLHIADKHKNVQFGLIDSNDNLVGLRN